MPLLQKTRDGRFELQVQGKPFLMLPAEVGNSAFSSVENVEQIFPLLKSIHVNTVLGAVCWDQVEQTEGLFDFSVLDDVIAVARRSQLRLIILWFGSFKNGRSDYAPHWVKADPARFPRAETVSSSGERLHNGSVSAIPKACCVADATAFARLMRHLREADRVEETVIMVQVENEPGLIGGTRDRCKYAEQAFKSPVPEALLDFLEKECSRLNGTLTATTSKWDGRRGQSWEETFGVGPRTDELFQAYHYARYIDAVAAAGRREYDVPLYTNAWLEQMGDEPPPTASSYESSDLCAAGGMGPGAYPSGGPAASVLDVYHAFCGNLSFFSPDIYLQNYSAVLAAYGHRGQALFIPEQRRDLYGFLRTWIAYGTYNALGAASFGIDTGNATQLAAAKEHFGLLEKIAPILLEARRSKRAIKGFFFDAVEAGKRDTIEPYLFQIGRWSLKVIRSLVYGQPAPGYGMIIQESDDRFLLVGAGFSVIFTPSDGNPIHGISHFHEKDVRAGKLVTLRHLNGDETMSGKAAVMPSADPDYGDFPIPITIPAKTRIAECRVYAVCAPG